MKRLTVGVIGHVDHGKSALVHALTGMPTDRLVEEQRRGISIALGFAHLTMDAAVVDLIDMPGHERFVRTMAAGASGIDAVLLVVDAREGIRPQTVEHVDIAGLLGVRRAVVAVTKADLVEPAQAAAVGAAACALAWAAGLAAAAPVVTSVRAGSGLEAARAALAEAVGSAAPAEDAGFPYLPVDRSFSLAGHGTIVTGTLRRGTLAPGDEVEVLPERLPVRVRGLQVNGAVVARAAPGQRVAVNLRGVEVGQAPRGTAICARGLLAPASWLSVTLRAVAPLRTAARLRLLIGTQETDVRLRLLDRDELAPGDTAPAQLHGASPVAVPARSRFILRSLSPTGTVGGGQVLDAGAARLRRHAPGVLQRLALLASLDPARIARAEVERAGLAGLAVDDLARVLGVAPARAVALLQELPVVLCRGGSAVAQPAHAALLARLPGLIAPHPAGLGHDALLALLPGARRPVLDDALARLATAGVVRQAGGVVTVPRPAEEQARAGAEAAAARQFLEALRLGGLTPPDLGSDPGARRLADRLVREGSVVRAPDRVQKRDILFHRDAVEAARRLLAPLLAAPGLLVREAGEALGISRKYSVPLLEHFDAIRFTRRVDDRRVLAHPP